MRTPINFHQPPQDVFLNPAIDAGLSLLAPAEYFWRPAPPALITGFAASAYPEVNARIDAHLTVTRRHKSFTMSVEFNTLPVLLEQPSFHNSYTTAQGRCVLSGASGTRLLNRYCWENEDKGVDPDDTLVAYFNACQAANTHNSIPVKPALQTLPIVINCRAYPHEFITETLSHLAALMARSPCGPHGDVHFTNTPEKSHPFILGFLNALFPDLAGRIHLHPGPATYGQALTALDLSCTYYQFPAQVVGDISPLAPSDAMFRGHDAYQTSREILAMNSFPSGLTALRTRAQNALQTHDFGHLPKRFFIAQRGDMPGHTPLFEMLHLFGFVPVSVENLTPLDQIALLANAEIMVAPHGAALTNMLFANPDAVIIDLGTLQTALHTWGDYWPLAHAAGCRYISFFADFNHPNPLTLPDIDLHGILSTALSNQAVAEVASLIATLLGHLPDLPSAAALHTLANRLIALREHGRALELLNRHAHLVKNNAALCLLMADCHKQHDDPHAELAALHLAHQADPARWQTLLRLIWCAKRCDLPDVMEGALSQLHQGFPARYAALVKSNPWLRNRL